MKLKQLVTGGALASAVLTLGSAQAEVNPYDGIVFCKAQTTEIKGDASELSVTLPFTTTGIDGKEYTHWNIGEIPPHGVADSWHSEKGPGKFVAHNNGRVGAYVYLTSSAGEYATNWFSQGSTSYPKPSSWIPVFQEEYEKVFGVCDSAIAPASSLTAWREVTFRYCLAFTIDMEAKNPTWHMLNHWWDGHNSGDSGWRKDDGTTMNERYYIGAYMGHLEAGEYMPFDVKFWAPGMSHTRVNFTFKVEAASFPLWEHDIEVK